MPGDRILVRRGEIVPVDGVVTQGMAVLDESALTSDRHHHRRPRAPSRNQIGQGSRSARTAAALGIPGPEFAPCRGPGPGCGDAGTRSTA
ncbi:P-type ATPase [Gluconacetobacter tumulicola]